MFLPEVGNHNTFSSLAISDKDLQVLGKALDGIDGWWTESKMMPDAILDTIGVD